MPSKLLSCNGFFYKVKSKLAFSQNMFLVPSQKLISRTEVSKMPKIGTTALQFRVLKEFQGFLMFGLLPIFFGFLSSIGKPIRGN